MLMRRLRSRLGIYCLGFIAASVAIAERLKSRGMAAATRTNTRVFCKRNRSDRRTNTLTFSLGKSMHDGFKAALPAPNKMLRSSRRRFVLLRIGRLNEIGPNATHTMLDWWA